MRILSILYLYLLFFDGSDAQFTDFVVTDFSVTESPFPATTKHLYASPLLPVRQTPPPDDARRDLRICLLLERSAGDRTLVYDYDRMAAGLDIGVQYVNDKVLLNDYKMSVYYKDIGKICARRNLVVKKALELMDAGVSCDVYFGPGCGYAAESLYNLAEYMQTPMIACPGFGFGSQAPRGTYTMATRTSYTTANTSKFIIRFLDINGYKHVTVLTDDSISFYLLLSPQLESRIQAREDLADVRFIPMDHTKASDEYFQSFLREGSATSRVFVVLAQASITRQLMVQAFRLGMTNGDFVFLGVEMYDSDGWGQFTWSAGDVMDRDAKQAFRALILVSLYQTQTDFFDSFSEEVKRIAKEKYNYTFNAFEAIDPVITHYYDTAVLYGNMVNQAIRSGSSPYDGPSMSLRSRNYTFDSLINGLVKIDTVGDRINDFVYRSLNPDTARFETYAIYTGIPDQLRVVGNTYWPTSSFPADVPHCGFLGDNPICLPLGDINPVSLGVGIVVPAVILLSILAFILLRRLRSEGVDPSWWRLNHADVDITATKAARSQSSLGSRGSRRSISSDGEIGIKSDAMSSTSMVGRTAMLKGNLVSVVDVNDRRVRPTPVLIKEMNQVRVLSHQNLQRVLGVSVDQDGFCCYLVGELCQKGSLIDLLEKDSLKLDWSFKNSLIKDTVMGMAYLHASTIESHGRLSAHTCLVDSRFLLKISDYGLITFRDPRDLSPPREEENERNFDMLLWRAPELMRQVMPVKGTQKGDVYSFGIILQQVILRSHPFDTADETDQTNLTAKDHVMNVKKGLQPPVRPIVPTSACSSELYNLMERCWDEYPIERPTFAKIRDGLKKVIGNSGDNIIDKLLKRMEQYALDLEAQVSEKTQQFAEEKKRTEELLSQLLPRSVAEALTRGLTVEPELYDSVTIYFSAIVGFTTISAAGTPMDVVSMLNNLYTFFDSVLDRYDAYKVETIGDAYMVGSGLPTRNGNKHAREIALVSITIRKELETFRIPHQPNDKLRLRIGINTGETFIWVLVWQASVNTKDDTCVIFVFEPYEKSLPFIVGMKMPRYCLFGDTVQLAMRMENTCEPTKIQLTAASKQLLDDVGGFIMQEREKSVEFKEKEVKTFWLTSASK